MGWPLRTTYSALKLMSFYKILFTVEFEMQSEFTCQLRIAVLNENQSEYVCNYYICNLWRNWPIVDVQPNNT